MKADTFMSKPKHKSVPKKRGEEHERGGGK